MIATLVTQLTQNDLVVALHGLQIMCLYLLGCLTAPAVPMQLKVVECIKLLNCHCTDQIHFRPHEPTQAASQRQLLSCTK